MPAYWDTSCLLKLYCHEQDSEDLLAHVADSRGALLTSALTETEIYFAFQQKALRGETGGRSADSLYEDFTADVEASRIQLLPIGGDIFKAAREIASHCYGQQPPLFVRSLDGLHLGTAQVTGCRQVLSGDKRMNEAAQALGMKTG